LSPGKPTIAVFGSSWPKPGSPEYDEARRLGQLLAEGGCKVVTGGYAGIMEGVSQGVQAAGGHAIGVTMSLFDPRPANSYLSEEIKVADFLPRLAALVRADGFIVLRGGIGTLSELSLTWSLLQTEAIEERPFILVGPHWKRVLQTFKRELCIKDKDFRLLHLVEGPEQAMEILWQKIIKHRIAQ